MSKPSGSRFRHFLDRVRLWWKREPDIPGDPLAYRVAPIRCGPKRRSGAAAVAEPEEDNGNSFAIRFFGKTPKFRN